MTQIFETNATFTPEMLAEARQYIGQELRVWQYNHYASLDTIRHYAHGIGDDNPLWCDEEYGRQTKYGCQIAPPLFLCSVFPTTIAPGLEGIHMVKGGDTWTFYRTIRSGDRIVPSARVVDMEVVHGKTAGQMVKQTGEVLYRTAGGELIAKVDTRNFRVMRPGSAGGGLAYAAREERQYSREELDRIEAEILAERPRGAEPRWWEDVSAGDEVPAVVKGPLDQISMTCYYAGAIGSPGYKAVELRWKQWQRAEHEPESLPNNFDISYFKERVLPSLGHQSNAVARGIGMPGAYDNGHQRMGWLGHCVTNWMGDDGFLRQFTAEIRRPNIFGNTTWMRGRVLDKFVDDDGAHLVSLELWGETQDGEINTRGSATVVLPSRGAGA